MFHLEPTPLSLKVDLMKLEGSLGNVPQKLKKLDIFRTVSPFSGIIYTSI
jgi:hypothetical protein